MSNTMFVITELSGGYDWSSTTVIGVTFSAVKAQEICDIKEKENKEEIEFLKDLNEFLHNLREKNNIKNYFSDLTGMLNWYEKYKDDVIDFYKKHEKEVKFNNAVELFMIKSPIEYSYEYEEVPVLDA